MRPLGVFSGISASRPGMDELAGALDEANQAAADAFDNWVHDACTHGVKMSIEEITRHAGLIKHFEALDGILHAYTAVYNDPNAPKDGGLVYKIPRTVAYAYTAASRQAEIINAVHASLVKNAATDRDLAGAAAIGHVAANRSAHVAAAIAAFAGASQAARDAHAASRSALAARDDDGYSWEAYALAVADTFQFAKDAMVRARHALYRVEPRPARGIGRSSGDAAAGAAAGGGGGQAGRRGGAGRSSAGPRPERAWPAGRAGRKS